MSKEAIEHVSHTPVGLANLSWPCLGEAAPLDVQGYQSSGIKYNSNILGRPGYMPWLDRKSGTVKHTVSKLGFT